MGYIQYRGPFVKNSSITGQITHVGIHLNNPTYNNEYMFNKSSFPAPVIKLDEEEFVIGKTGVLEIQDCNYSSITFLNNVDGYVELEVEE